MKLRKKNIKILFFSIILLIVLLILLLLIGRLVWIKTADTSWIADFGYGNNEIYTLKLDKSGIPEIPVIIDEGTYYFDFDTGCSNDIVVTNVLENKIDYSILEQIEELNRDGSHRGWSNRIKINKIQVGNQEYDDIICSITDWKMSSSYKFAGMLGTELFNNALVTLDYRAHKIGISNTPNYSSISNDKYSVIPMLHTNMEGQENLIFFECKLNGENIVAYIDTGKNISYVHNKESEYIIGKSNEKPRTNIINADITIGNTSFKLDELYEANMPQNYDFNYPVALELNSNQLTKNDIVISFDFINDYIIFYNR